MDRLWARNIGRTITCLDWHLTQASAIGESDDRFSVVVLLVRGIFWFLSHRIYISYLG